jgi:hypothetical protein
VTQNYQDLIPDVEIVLEVLRHFIRRGFTGLQRTRRGGRTVLHAAMDRGHYPSARYLINRFPDLLDKQDAKRYTPLHFAAKRWWPVWKLGPLRMLCALGADVNVLVREQSESRKAGKRILLVLMFELVLHIDRMMRTRTRCTLR